MSRPAIQVPAGLFLARSVAPFFAALLVLSVAVRLAAQETPAPAEAEERPGPEVVDLDFNGASALDRDRLEAATVTRETRCKSALFFLFCALGAGWAQERAYLDEEELARDDERLETLYEIWGYPDAEVTSRVIPRGRDKVAVEFDIVEGQPIRVASLEIRGLETLSPPVRLEEPLPIGPGDVYALPLLEELQRRIVNAFAERGRPYTQVEIQGSIDEAARTANLVLVIDPGPPVVFGPATIVPEEPIEEEVIRERLAFAPGDPFRPSALEATERALYRLPIVERVVIEPAGLETGNTVVSPRITVETRQAQGLQIEGTVSSTDCLEAATFWTHRYFLGGPRLFSVGVGFSNLLANVFDGNFPCTSSGEGEFADPDYFVEADLRQPWPGSPRTSLQVGAFFLRESSPQAYIQRGYGGMLGVAREIRYDLVGSAVYSPQRSELRAADIYFCGNFGVCEPESLENLTELRWFSPVELLGIWTPTGVPIEVRHAVPGERWRRWVRGGIDGAGVVTGSEWDYLRGIGEGALTRIIGDRFELAARTRLGLLTGAAIVPPQVRIYSGGVSTIRGLPQNFLGPKVLVTAPDDLPELGCVLETFGCPPGIVVDPDLVGVRPSGGDALLELNLEGRVWVSNSIQLVGFVDFGTIDRDFFNSDEGLFGGENAETLVTPGVGVRILTGLGPVRVDVGYDPSGRRRYPLLVRDTLSDRLVFLGDVTYDPFTFDNPGAFKEFIRRLQLQVAIGQPF